MEEIRQWTDKQIILNVRKRFIGSQEMNYLNIYNPTKAGNHK